MSHWTEALRPASSIVDVATAFKNLAHTMHTDPVCAFDDAELAFIDGVMPKEDEFKDLSSTERELWKLFGYKYESLMLDYVRKRSEAKTKEDVDELEKIYNFWRKQSSSFHAVGRRIQLDSEYYWSKEAKDTEFFKRLNTNRRPVGRWED